MGEMTRREKWVIRENKWNGQEVKGERGEVGKSGWQQRQMESSKGAEKWKRQE